MDTLQIRNLLGGFGLFLFGISIFEEGIETSSTSTLKKVVEARTNTKLKSILTGTFITSIVQSSTIVTMIVLGFVGAGLLAVNNAIGVVLGANLGSSITPRIVTLIGFKLNIESIALPIIAIGGIGMLLFNRESKSHTRCKMAVGFWLLFLGLGFMKESMDVLGHTTDLLRYEHIGLRWMILTGIILTIILQTSTATSILTLAALNSGIITFDMALGIMIGANIGTPSTALIGWFLSSIGNTRAKKQVALSHFFFNIFAWIIVIVFLPQIRNLIENTRNLWNEPLYSLAAFHTLYNLIGVIVLWPIIPLYARIIKRLVPEQKANRTLGIQKIESALPEEIIATIKQDLLIFIQKICSFYSHVFQFSLTVKPHTQKPKPSRRSLLLQRFDGNGISLRPQHGTRTAESLTKEYEEIKTIEQRLFAFLINSDKTTFSKDQLSELELINNDIAWIAFGAKSIKDMKVMILELKHSKENYAQEVDHNFKERMQNSLRAITHHIRLSQTVPLSDYQKIIDQIDRDDDHFLKTMMNKISKMNITQEDLTEIMKINRSIVASCKSLIETMKNLWL